MEVVLVGLLLSSLGGFGVLRHFVYQVTKVGVDGLKTGRIFPIREHFTRRRATVPRGLCFERLGHTNQQTINPVN